MQDTLTASTRVIVRHVQGLDCPKCSSPVYRVPRRVLDLLLGAFQPVRRYHCRSMVCGWEGNLRALPAVRERHGHFDSYRSGRCRIGPSLPGGITRPANDGDVKPSSPGG